MHSTIQTLHCKIERGMGLKGCILFTKVYESIPFLCSKSYKLEKNLDLQNLSSLVMLKIFFMTTDLNNTLEMNRLK